MPKHPSSKRGGLNIRIRVILGDDIVVGPGKADLLEGIKQTGSIAAAGRRMGMSYKRAWYLIDAMNKCFSSPVVEAVKGGKVGGGTELTPTGLEVLRRYRQIEQRCRRHTNTQLTALGKILR